MVAPLLAALLVVASNFSLASSQPSQSAAEHHWLVGIWEGSLANWPQGSKARQTMRVLSVAPNGAAQGTWFITGEYEYLSTIKVTGARVQVMSNAYSVIDLTRQGEDELTGSFALAGGARYRIALKKLTVPSDPATDLLARKLVGRWEGTVELPPWERESARTLVIDSIQQKDGAWMGAGRYGITGRGLGKVEIEVDNTASDPVIRFTTANQPVRLAVSGARDLIGNLGIIRPAFLGKDLRMQLRRAQWPDAVIVPKLPIRAAALKQVGDELAVGKNRTGESCTVRLVQSVASANPYERFGLFCEGWSQPSGEIHRFIASKEWPPKRFMTEGRWYQGLSGRLGDCRDVEATRLVDGSEAALRECTRAQGGWRAVILGAIVGQEAYTLEGLPTNLPVLELAVLVLAGKRPPEATSGNNSMGAGAPVGAETMVGATGALVGVQDVGAHATLWDLGEYRDFQADWAAAEAAFRRVLEIEERLAGLNRPQSGLTISRIGELIGLQRRFGESDQWFIRAEPLLKQDYVPWHYPLHLTWRSGVERFRGKYAESIRYGEEAIRIHESQRTLYETSFAEALTMTVRAYWAAGKLDEVESGLLRVLALLDKPGPGPGFRAWRVGETHHDLGILYLGRNRLSEARTHLELGLKQRESFLGPSLRAAWSLLELGRLGRAEGSLPRALEAYRRAADIGTKDSLTREMLRSDEFAGYFATLLELAQAAPEQSATLSVELFSAAQIPQGGETAKAITAMSARLASADPAVRSATRDYQEAVRRRDRAREAYAAEPFRAESDRNFEREEALKEAWRTAESQVALLEEGLQAKFPKYVSLTASKPLSISDVTSLIRPGEAVLSIVQTNRAAYVLLAREGQVFEHRAPLSAAVLRQHVTDLRKGLDLADGHLRAFDRALAFQLYQSLLAPLADRLQGVTHLITVPTGPLQSLPLAVLVTQPPASTGGDDYRDAAWLGKQFAISVLPSIASLKDLRATAGRPAAPLPFIGFGDPAFGGAAGAARSVTALANACRDGALMDVEFLRGLPRLPETAEEIRQMAQTLGASPDTVVLGANATERRVRSTDLSQYRVIAFATHGLLPGDLKCKAEPALALTPPATPSADEDGLLDASEVAQLRLDADFVVLSACNTAAPDGRLLGEALSGLARGFFYAGARSVLASHWAVASQPTAVLTTGLFAEYTKDRLLGRAAALKRAQEAMWQRADMAHPALWAAFVLVGDGGPEAP